MAEHIVQFNNEKKAFANLRNNNNVVRCLASYSHANTHNLLLEYGEMDLEVYFVNHHPPFFEQEVVRFWREILEVAKAIEGMHDWKSLHDGKKYHGFVQDASRVRSSTIDSHTDGMQISSPTTYFLSMANLNWLTRVL